MNNLKPDKTKFKTINNILLHLHPASIPEGAIQFNRTFGLGGMAALLIVIQFITGIMMRFYYEPLPGNAYDSIIHLQNNVLFGQFIRNIHHWSGMFVVPIVFLHLLRIFYTGAFQNKRKINWLIGLALLMLVIFSNFTGYLLPWDQLAYWAITVSTAILQYIPFIGDGIREFFLGGSEVGADTLLIFYTLHTSVLPGLLILLMAWHFWRIRKAGGVLVPKNNDKKNVPVFPELVKREFVVALVVIAVVFTLAVFLNAPLLDKANPNFSLNPTKAPWYFEGIQELLMHFHPFFAAVLIPVSVITLMAFLPYYNYREENGLWFNSQKGKSTVAISSVVAVVFTVLVICANEYLLNFETMFGSVSPLISNGLAPLLIYGGIIAAIFYILKWKYNLTRYELIQVIFTFIITAFIVLTITDVFFRGVNMELSWPWNL